MIHAIFYWGWVVPTAIGAALWSLWFALHVLGAIGNILFSLWRTVFPLTEKNWKVK